MGLVKNCFVGRAGYRSPFRPGAELAAIVELLRLIQDAALFGSERTQTVTVYLVENTIHCGA